MKPSTLFSGFNQSNMLGFSALVPHALVGSRVRFTRQTSCPKANTDTPR